MRRLLFVILLFLSLSSWAQNPLYFHTRFGSESVEIGNGIIQTKDGGYAIIGQTTGYGALQNDILLSKNDSLGIPIWIKTFGGYGADIGTGLVEMPDSSIVFVGYSNSFGVGGYDAIIYRVNKNGNLIWRKTFGGADWDFGYAINRTNDNGLIICGSTYSFERGGMDGFILKLDIDGNFLWSKIYGGKKDDDLKKVIQTSDGGYIAVGTSRSYGDSLGNIWVTKFTATGDSVWFRERGGSKRDIGNSIVQDLNGDFLICGGSESYSNGKLDAYVFRLASDGSFLNDRWIGAAENDEEAFDVLNSGSEYGKVLITYGVITPGMQLDISTVLLDYGLYYVRGGSFGGVKNDIGLSLFNTKDKGYVACGYTESFNAQLKDVFIVKYDSEMTIGPLIISLEDKIKTSSTKVFPGIISENFFLIKTNNKNSIPKVKITDLNGNIAEKLEIQIVEADCYKVLLLPGTKGMIIVDINEGEVIRKCIVQ
jgi:hypothetical protein